jgi:hypothetical protein
VIAKVGYSLFAAWWLALFGTFTVVNMWGLIEWAFYHVVVPYTLPFALVYSWVTS